MTRETLQSLWPKGLLGPTMEGATYRVLCESVIRTLHSQNFARSSSEACNVLADLLSRYLKLLALTCAKHAQHCGRSELTTLDAVRSLEELGASLPELKSFQEVDGKDLARYAYCSQRRQMDLREIKCKGLSQCCMIHVVNNVFNEQRIWQRAFLMIRVVATISSMKAMKLQTRKTKKSQTMQWTKIS